MSNKIKMDGIHKKSYDQSYETGDLSKRGRRGTEHNDILHNDTQHIGLISDTQHNNIQPNDTRHIGLISDTWDK